MKTSLQKKRRILLISLILIVCTLLSYFLLPFTVIIPPRESRIVADQENGTLVASDNSIRILHLTDTHINGKLEMPLAFSIMKAAIYKSKPDLIVITGDVFSKVGYFFRRESIIPKPRGID